MKNKKLTLTVGIPAHNEETNIARLLVSLLNQKRDGFVLEKIVVVCDGCTDKTPEIVNKMIRMHKEITLHNDGLRKGKSERISHLVKNVRSDVLLCLDADVIFRGRSNLNVLMEAFKNGTNVGLVGGQDIPVNSKAFFGRVAVVWINHWHKLMRPRNSYDNVQNCQGRCYAVSKQFAKKAKIPKNLNAEDHFLYFRAHELGFGFKYCPGLKVHFSAPSDISGFISQSSRFGGSGLKLTKLYGKNYSDNYPVKFTSKMGTYLNSFLKNPLLFSVAILMQIYIKVCVAKYPIKKEGVWNPVKSTKTYA